MDYQKVLEKIYDELTQMPKEGQLASYIPELAKVDPDKFAFCLETKEGQLYSVGDVNTRFSLQSIAKVFSLVLAYIHHGESLWERVGVEPSGNPFNSLIQLEYESGKPRNPFINPGALVISDILCSTFSNPKEEILKFVRQLSKNHQINFNENVAKSEADFGYKNAAHINLMKSFGNIENSVDEVLDFYYHLCSIEMNVKELAHSFMIFVNHGFVEENQRILGLSATKRLNALMLTCGFYDEAGEFSYLVGLPGKSGVGGGIAAVHPEHFSTAVWSPRLNAKGNSFLGMKSLELLTTLTEQSIF
ncbi:MAG: glutaminase [Bacteroidales bacterium]|nr:glutaminase [Bacteroidales bacterium]